MPVTETIHLPGNCCHSSVRWDVVRQQLVNFMQLKCLSPINLYILRKRSGYHEGWFWLALLQVSLFLSLTKTLLGCGWGGAWSQALAWRPAEAHPAPGYYYVLHHPIWLQEAPGCNESALHYGKESLMFWGQLPLLPCPLPLLVLLCSQVQGKHCSVILHEEADLLCFLKM